MEISESQLAIVLGNLLCVALLEQGVRPQAVWDSVMANPRSRNAGQMVL